MTKKTFTERVQTGSSLSEPLSNASALPRYCKMRPHETAIRDAICGNIGLSPKHRSHMHVRNNSVSNEGGTRHMPYRLEIFFEDIPSRAIDRLYETVHRFSKKHEGATIIRASDTHISIRASTNLGLSNCINSLRREKEPEIDIAPFPTDHQGRGR